VHTHHIHLAIAKKVNELLKLEEDPFYFGVVVGDFKNRIPKKTTHFQTKYIINNVKVMLSNYEEFAKKYKEKLNNPIYMGYLVHLMIDYYFNKNTFTNYWVIENNIIVGAKLNNGKILYGDMKSRRRLRVNDYEVYDNYVSQKGCYNTPKYSENLYEKVKELKIIPISKDDIFTIIESLNVKTNENLVKKLFKKKYKLYTNEEMSKCFENCVVFIKKYFEENLVECK
jgi:hypothetical protein